MSFLGTQEVSVDNKGRIAVPTKHRDVFTDKGGVLTAHPTGCLYLYTAKDWQPVYELYNQPTDGPDVDERLHSLQSFIIGSAEEVALDSSGRILISPFLRKHARIDGTVLMRGVINRFEIWDVGVWDAYYEARKNIVFKKAEGAA